MLPRAIPCRPERPVPDTSPRTTPEVRKVSSNIQSNTLPCIHICIHTYIHLFVLGSRGHESAVPAHHYSGVHLRVAIPFGRRSALQYQQVLHTYTYIHTYIQFIIIYCRPLAVLPTHRIRQHTPRPLPLTVPPG